jgi:hypothetical protein
MRNITSQTAKFRRTVRRLRALLPAEVLSILDPETVLFGILERLWHTAAASAPRGDIGRLADDLICESCGWLGDTDSLIPLLIECGWIDTSDQYRLVIHDWADHAPNHVRGNVKRHHGGFCVPATVPDTERLYEPPTGASPEEPPCEAPIGTVPPHHTTPHQSTPDHTSPHQTGRRRRVVEEILSSREAAPEPDPESAPEVAGEVTGELTLEPTATGEAPPQPQKPPQQPDPDQIDREAVNRACRKLVAAYEAAGFAGVDRGFVWRVCWTAAAIAVMRGGEGGMVGEWATAIRSRTIKVPRRYIEKGIEVQAKNVGLDLPRWNRTFPQLPTHSPVDLDRLTEVAR